MRCASFQISYCRILLSAATLFFLCVVVSATRSSTSGAGEDYPGQKMERQTIENLRREFAILWNKWCQFYFRGKKRTDTNFPIFSGKKME
jgi:hypothetical protein